jgi:ATP-dependent DNA helicase RecQ
LTVWLAQQGFKVAAYHAGMCASDRRRIEQDWLGDRLQFVVCTNAFGMGINKPNLRWMVHYHAPLLLSEYVQEIGRAGRDGRAATTLALVSERTGWLNSEDQQRRQFFQDQERQQREKAQQLLKHIPTQGDVRAIAREFEQGAIALSLLNSAGLLDWQDPFQYVIQQRPKLPATQAQAVDLMVRYLYTSECRWNFLLRSFGFEPMAVGCGHCDRCVPSTR